MRSMQTVEFLKGKQGGGLGACLWLGSPPHRPPAPVNSSSPCSFSRLSSQTPSTDFSRLVSPTCGPLGSPLAVTLLLDPLCLPRALCKGRSPALPTGPAVSRTVSVSPYK